MQGRPEWASFSLPSEERVKLSLKYGELELKARKFRLNLITAHQYLGQLEDEVRAAIFGNVGTLISFRVGAEDAQYLAREFYPVFSEDDFLNLPAHHIYLRMPIDGVASRPFSARTIRRDPAGDSALAAYVCGLKGTSSRMLLVCDL
jgi:hypothetical protein